MRYMILFFLSLIFFSCSTKDEAFCKCLEYSKKLDSLSIDVQKNKNKKIIKEFQLVKNKKLKHCFPFKTLSGKELLEKKESCLK